METKIAILILFFNRLSETIQCIESFIPSRQPIYVLNNGSDLLLWKQLQNTYRANQQVTLFHSDVNLGVSVGRNYLIKCTTEPWLLIVDNDIIIQNPDGWKHIFDNILFDRPVLQVVALRIYNSHEKNYVKSIRVLKENRKVTIKTTDDVFTNCFPGTGSIIHRGIFKAHGLFDESLFVGFEDYEYAIRCMNSPNGELTVFHTEEIVLVHNHKFQESSIDKLAVKERYNERKIQDSYDRIVKKYDIDFEHNWEWWTRKQVREMTQNKIAKMLTRIKMKIKTIAAWS